ncbi:diacylglycerol/lipid kinase family protein [Alicyclobacillus mengziensis]|uniref:Diacylglycerol kinase family lipid kinase n=1 Tax=Alicyclobacillus mengziensis TaxID=2931921 RepID=A0A9X7Z7X1_9BACL|nr:diacylglycerol kinase family protein [Alicyclobacillus mengziensis]QSO47716.1 diacylglycerol kinase family lipid kinase [Alicyclobacillus mengziensis]
MRRRLHFLVNREAGRGRALETWDEVSSSIVHQASVRGVDITFTHSFAGDPIPFHELAPDTILVSVGGDGSVHYAAQEAVKRGFVLGVVPAGTGNDFAKNLGLPSDLPGIIDVLLLGEPQPIDAVQVNNTHVFNLAGYGIDAEVVNWIESHPWIKKIGRLGYGVVVPVVLWRHRPFHVAVSVDGKELHHFPKASIFAIANGALFGGGMRIAPTASLSDGQLNLVVASGLSKFSILRLFTRIYRGTHVSHPAVTCMTGRHFIIEFSGPPTAAEYDGEAYPFPYRTEVHVQPGLRVLLPMQTLPT